MHEPFSGLVFPQHGPSDRAHFSPGQMRRIITALSPIQAFPLDNS
jgi:hypothetical protein